MHLYAAKLMIAYMLPWHAPTIRLYCWHAESWYGHDSAQAMQAADPAAQWLMQAWLFYDDQDFWQPPQIQACMHMPRLRARCMAACCTPLLCVAPCT
jgi:hypothetical protein